jgi:hypothetical protein
MREKRGRHITTGSKQASIYGRCAKTTKINQNNGENPQERRSGE